MELIKEIRNACTDPSVKVGHLLRKAKVLAAMLRNEPLKLWLASELNGYSADEELPPYRKISAPTFGTFSSPFRRTDQPLPVSFMPEALQKMADAIHVVCGIGEIEVLAESASSGLRHSWPPETAMLLRQIFTLGARSVLVEVYQPISKANLEGILDGVRNRLLDFVLGLQELNPEVLDSEKALTGLAGERVTQVFNFAIYGDHAVVASGKDFSQTVTHGVSVGDLESLLGYLRQLGMPSEDLQDLRTAVEKDGPPQKKQLGERVTAWMGRVLTKAITGSWKIVLATAPELLKQALFHYYGWA